MELRIGYFLLCHLNRGKCYLGLFDSTYYTPLSPLGSGGFPPKNLLSFPIRPFRDRMERNGDDVKMKFLTRHKDKQVFPIGNGREIRRDDDYVPESDVMKHKESEPEIELDDPNDEDYALMLKEEQARKEELKEEQRKRKELQKLQKPSYVSKASAKSDVKKLMRSDDSKVNKEKEFSTYKKRLDRDLTETYLKEDRKSDKRREHALSKAEKLEQKSQKLEEKSKVLKGKYE
jgi:hypothetical protein